jgi:hypothetical protein
MCHYITLVVRGSDGAAIDQILRRHNRRASPIDNASIAGVLVAGEMQFLTTVGHCDCGTALAPCVVDRASERAKQAARLAKKGWSKAKIERWLADRTKADDRVEERGHADSPDSIELWSRIVGDLLSTPGVQQAGLLLHFYSGAVEEEGFELTRETVRFRDFEPRLRDMREDQLLMAAA